MILWNLWIDSMDCHKLQSDSHNDNVPATSLRNQSPKQSIKFFRRFKIDCHDSYFRTNLAMTNKILDCHEVFSSNNKNILDLRFC